jgi:hypothetical protein
MNRALFASLDLNSFCKFRGGSLRQGWVRGCPVLLNQSLTVKKSIVARPRRR